MRGTERLHPEARKKADAFLSECGRLGLNVLITETWRTMAEQDALYAQGRTKPGNIITNCKGSDYQSPHQWGVAFDFCKNIKGQEYNDTTFFKQVGTLGKSIGLRWGGDFQSMVDMPHFQLNSLLVDSDFTTTLKKQYGTPEIFKATWESAPPKEEGKLVDQKQFDDMMDDWIARRRAMPAGTWNDDEFNKAIKANITDGTRPKDFATREEAAVISYRVFERLTQIVRDAKVL